VEKSRKNENKRRKKNRKEVNVAGDMERKERIE